MVRINLVSPIELTDQHLIAEYDEILMLCGALTKTLKSKVGFQSHKISKSYVLGKGHIYFFFDKGKYLHRRFDELRQEMMSRGFTPTKMFPVLLWPSNLYNDYTPTQEALQIVRERIKLRINKRPNWYRYRGQKL